MRLPLAVAGLLAAAAVPAHAAVGEPVVQDCSTRAYGDLGRGWGTRAVTAGPLAFVGMADHHRAVPRAASGRAAPLKVLVVVEPRSTATLSIAVRSRRIAALAYATGPLPERADDGTVPLVAGSASVRFEACARPNAGAAWNRGTQFPGYFLVARAGCVTVDVRAGGTTIRRTLRFGTRNCK